jgi:hypothetical protein
MTLQKQNQLKLNVIEQLRKIPIIQVACEKTGVSRATFYRWKQEDSEFGKSCEAALSDGVALVNDMAESQLLSAIKEKNTTAIFYWLNHRHPSYGNKLEVTTRADLGELNPEQQQLVARALQHASILIEDATTAKENV